MDVKPYKTGREKKGKMIFSRTYKSNDYAALIAVAISVLFGWVSLFSSIIKNTIILVILGLILAAVVVYFFNLKFKIKRHI